MALPEMLEKGDNADELENTDVLPKALIVRGFDEKIFTDDQAKKKFESLFIPFGDLHFTYLPGFRRIIVNYTKGKNAIIAKELLHDKSIDGCSLKIFFKEEAKKVGEDFLKLPQSEKLFLISPPASPPVGWTQKVEPIPVVNYDLLTAIAGLEMPDKRVQLIPRTDSTPAIMVEGCENPEPLNNAKPLKSMKSLTREEVQTKRPPLKASP